MTATHKEPKHFHGPDNAEHEIRKAYNCVIETGVNHFWDRKAVPGVNADEVVTLYKNAFHQYQKKNRLAAERWARTAKHLSRAIWHEAKIAFLEPRTSELPFLEGATDNEYGLYERSDTTADLLNSVANHIPAGLDAMPDEMKRYLSRGLKHLKILEQVGYTHELLRAERIQAAHEYGRTLECMALAFEAETQKKTAA